jgi:hypothetical protein
MRATDRLAAAPPVNDEGRPVAEPARVEKDRQSLPQEEIQGQDSTADESGRVQSALDYQAQGPGRLPPRRGASICLQDCPRSSRQMQHRCGHCCYHPGSD